MKERSIILTAQEVQGFLAGRQTQLRRVVKPQPAIHRTEVAFLPSYPAWCWHGPWLESDGKPKPMEKWPGGWPDCGENIECPFGKPGDRLWVKEGWWKIPEPSLSQCRAGADTWPKVAYLADEPIAIYEEYKEWGWKAKPSIHMPKWDSRLTLEVTEVRVQRLQEISFEDMIAEGVTNKLAEAMWGERWWIGAPKVSVIDAYNAYQHLWESINGAGSWDANPWVWAVTVKAVS